jgi:phosphoribosyl 1,2-cyclic phosphate phosphodiesterase
MAHHRTGLTLTFLGTGTSQGVPVIACDCPVCRSADPRDCRTRSSVYMETLEAAWVIDTGPEFRVQCLREGVHRVDAVVYTHAHSDHIMGFDDLRQFCQGAVWEAGLPIYAGPETLASLRQSFHFAFNGQNAFPGYIKPQPRELAPYMPFQIGETTLTPLPLTHGRAAVYGYLFERGGRKIAAYLTDCKTVPPGARERLRGVEILIVDALRWREHPTHMSIREALELATDIRPGATWFTHICHELAHAETEAALAKSVVPNVRLAFDGLQLPL